MGRIEADALALGSPAFEDERVEREAAECLQAPRVVAGAYDVRQMPLKLGMIVAAERLTEASLIVRVIRSTWPLVEGGFTLVGEPTFDTVLAADAAEDVREGVGILGAVGELNAVVGEDRVYLVENSLHEVALDPRRLHFGRPPLEPQSGDFRCAVDGGEQGQTAFGRSDFSQIDMEIAEGMPLDARFRGLVSRHVRQA